jgi:hypothetical protein
MTREQAASNGYHSADNRERVEKEDETMAECAIPDETVDQIGHAGSPCGQDEKYSAVHLH